MQVLPSLHEHREEVLLRELLTRWNNHKVMVRWLSRFFNYLDRWVIWGGGVWVWGSVRVCWSVCVGGVCVRGC